jgi:hypothetical protein
VTLWEVDIHPAAGQPDLLAARCSARRLISIGRFSVRAARGFLMQGNISAEQVSQIARELLADLLWKRRW